MAALAGRCRELQSFSAASSGGLDDDGLAALGAGCPKLTFVGVDRCAQVTLDGIMRLANRCAALQVVGMAGVHGRAGAEQQAAFARWVEARGWRFDHRAGLLAAQ